MLDNSENQKELDDEISNKESDIKISLIFKKT
jgi:hypothetical protein